MHQKLLTINGNFNGDSSAKVLWTGSQNFTDEGNGVNNELLVRINDGPTLDQYVSNLNYIRDHHTKGRIRRVPGYFSSAARVQGRGADVGAQVNGREPFDFDLPANGDVDFDR